MSFFPIMAAGIAAMAETEQTIIELNNLGVELAGQGNFEKALECFYQAHALAPDDATIRNNIQLCIDAMDSE